MSAFVFTAVQLCSSLFPCAVPCPSAGWGSPLALSGPVRHPLSSKYVVCNVLRSVFSSFYILRVEESPARRFTVFLQTAVGYPASLCGKVHLSYKVPRTGGYVHDAAQLVTQAEGVDRQRRTDTGRVPSQQTPAAFVDRDLRRASNPVGLPVVGEIQFL